MSIQWADTQVCPDDGPERGKVALIDLDVDRGEGVIDAYGWPPDILDEDILSKLLALNLERAGEQMPTYITFEAKALTVKTPLSKGKKDKS